jgi:hypothetical protein
LPEALHVQTEPRVLYGDVVHEHCEPERDA